MKTKSYICIQKYIGFAAFIAAMFGSQLAMAETLKIATDSGARGSDAGNSIEEWARQIETATNGEIELEIFYQNELGGQQEVFDLLMLGEVDLMLNWPMTSYDQRIALIYTPYMFSKWDEALNAYAHDGWLNNMLNDFYADLGLKFLGVWPEGFNGIATKNGHATTIEEASSLKVRVPPVFPFTETVSALGYQTATIDWGELYSAIQTGVVDGDAANVIFYDYTYFGDLLTDYVHTRQQFLTGILTANSESLRKLSDNQRKIIEDAAISVMNNQFEAAQAADQAYIEDWKELGHTYIYLEDESFMNHAAVVREKIWPQIEKVVGKETMSLVKNHSFALKE